MKMTKMRAAAATTAIGLTALGSVSVARAAQAEGGYRNCGSTIAYVRARYNDQAGVKPPGVATTTSWTDNDGSWHTREKNGVYAGDWEAVGYDLLDFAGTYSGCRTSG
jgi:hypothetical protein